MKKFVKIAALALSLTTVLAACGNDEKKPEPTGVSQSDVKEFTIKATNFSFEPSEIRVKKGDTVRLTLDNAEGYHGVEVKGLDVILDDTYKTVEFTAEKTGEFEFVCSVMCGTGHDDMKGKLIVE